MKPVQAALLSVSLAGTLLGMPAFAADDAGQNAVVTPDEDTMIIAEAPGGAPGGERHHGWHHPGMQLTDDQLSRLADIKEAVREKTAAQRSEMHALRFQLQKALMAPTVDKAGALAIQSKINALHDQIASARLAGRIDAMSVFTPEQREHIRHMMLVRGAFGGFGRRGHRKHGGCGGECGGGHGGPRHGDKGGWMRHRMEEHGNGGDGPAHAAPDGGDS